MKMKEISESTNKELLNSKKWLTAAIIVSPIMLVVFSIISYLTGTGYVSLKVFVYVMIPNIIFCYFFIRKINIELKSREISK